MSRPDGGQAFPEPGVWDGDRNQVNPVGAYYDAGGMSLRDYFAAEALAGMLSAVTLDDIYQIANNQHSDRRATIARAAGKMADAMIAERAKP